MKKNWLQSTMIGIISILVTTGCTVAETSKMDDIVNVCDLPEELSAFEDYVTDHYGASIDGAVADKLEEEFSSVKDVITNDYFYSRTEKVRLAGFSTTCKAKDGVHYTWQIAAIISLKDKPIYRQLDLFYEKEDIIAGNRKFAFGQSGRRKSDYADMISKESKGMNREQFAKYMHQLGANFRNPGSEPNVDVYEYKIDFENCLACRLAIYEFNISVIVVGFDANNIVREVIVR